MHKHGRRGMTLVEVVIATSLLAVVVVMAMSAFAELLATTSSQTSLTRADQIANQALREISTQLRSAVLPVQVGDGKREKNDPFYWVDNHTYGFGKNSWGNDLKEGLDFVAFVHPVDALGVGDFLDSENHLMLGQVRGEYTSGVGGSDPQEIAYLAATAEFNADNDFIYRTHSTELVSVLAGIPAKDFIPNRNLKASDSGFEWWASKPSGADVTCFTAIRFVPVMNNGEPFTIKESEYKIDLDADGEANGEFEVGRLELIYSGSADGFDFPYVYDGVVESKSTDQVVINLTPDVILRRKDDDPKREPIFKLVKPTFEVNSTDDARLTAMRIRILVLDTEGITIEQSGSGNSAKAELVFNKATRKVSARWYQTSVVIKNLDR